MTFFTNNSSLINKKVEGLPSSLLLRFNGNLLDSSPSNFSVTAYSGASVTASQSKFGGGSLSVAGTSNISTSYVKTDTNIAILSGEDFTVEAWIYRAVPATFAYEAIIFISDASQTNFFGLFTKDDGGREFMCFTRVNGNYSYPTSGYVSTVPTGQWVHVAASRQSGRVRTFINGTLIEQSPANTYTAALTGTIQVGGMATTGYLDDVRVVKGLAIYTANFTPPVAELPANIT